MPYSRHLLLLSKGSTGWLDSIVLGSVLLSTRLFFLELWLPRVHSCHGGGGSARGQTNVQGLGILPLLCTGSMAVPKASKAIKYMPACGGRESEY